MKIIITIVLICISAFLFSQSVLSPALINELAQNENEYLDVNLYFSSHSSIFELDKQLSEKKASFDNRVKSVNNLLNSNAEISLSEFAVVLDYILSVDSKAVGNMKFYRSVNMLNIEIKPCYLYYLSDQFFIKYIDINSPRYKLIEGEKQNIPSLKIVGGVEPGIKAINAHKLWEKGYSGRNILFLSMDTGVFPTHPAISENFAGNYFPLSQCWYGVRSPEPVDNAGSSHGTHTTGTVLGLDPATKDTIGVAFNAKWIASDPVASNNSDLLTPTDFMNVFDWVLNPDGDESTTNDVPRVINNSWGYDYDLALAFGACDLPEAEIFVVLETAGICSPFSAGNDGPGTETTGFPAMLAYNIVNPMSIGAVNGNSSSFDIASFSSRGPSPCVEDEGRLKIKPEVVAPGINVRSCVGTDSYDYLQGTSMACPHVSGALLLLAEAFPMASAYELKLALYESAIDLGEPGEDNIYGNGMIDVLAAFNYLSEIYTPIPPINDDFDLSLSINSNFEELCCGNDGIIQLNIKVENLGLNPINGYRLKAYLNESIICDSIVNISIEAQSFSEFIISDIQLQEGINYVYASTTPLENIVEFDRFNNSFNKKILSISERELPYFQNFENLSSGLNNSEYVVVNPDMKTTWGLIKWGQNDEYTAVGVKFNDYMPRNGQVDDLFLPQIFIPNNVEDVFLSFTYAYKNRLSFIYKDSLLVEASVDCGKNFNKILFANGGQNMATVLGDSNSKVYKPNEASEFDTINIALNEFKGENLLLRFRTINDKGSVLYIDEIKISELDNNYVFDEKKLNQEPEIWPNPFGNFVNIKIFDKNDILEIFDLSGRLINRLNLNSEFNKFDLECLDNGIYLFYFKNSGITKRIVKNM